MLEVLRFLFMQIIAFMRMLFTIDLGHNLNLGLLLCIVFIFLPMMLRIINFLKQDAMEELNNAYEESRPMTFFNGTYNEHTKLSNGKTFDYSITNTYRRRLRK